jgi:hypothetical protein
LRRRFEEARRSNWLADEAASASTNAAAGSSSSNVPQPPRGRSPRKSQRQRDAAPAVSGKAPLELLKMLPGVISAIDKRSSDANSRQPAPGNHPKRSPRVESETAPASYADKSPALQTGHGTSDLRSHWRPPRPRGIQRLEARGEAPYPVPAHKPTMQAPKPPTPPLRTPHNLSKAIPGPSLPPHKPQTSAALPSGDKQPASSRAPEEEAEPVAGVRPISRAGSSTSTDYGAFPFDDDELNRMQETFDW